MTPTTLAAALMILTALGLLARHVTNHRAARRLFDRHQRRAARRETGRET